MLAFYVGVFGFVTSLVAASLWGWPFAFIAIPLAVLASRAKGRLYEPEPDARSSNSAIGLVIVGFVVAFLVYAVLVGTIVSVGRT